MKSWTKVKDNKIILGAVMSIKVDGDSVRFREECDQYLEVNMSIRDAKQALTDALLFIEEAEKQNETPNTARD